MVLYDLLKIWCSETLGLFLMTVTCEEVLRFDNGFCFCFCLLRWLFLAVRGLLIAVASLVEHGL